jgi:hypothetical protein
VFVHFEVGRCVACGNGGRVRDEELVEEVLEVEPVLFEEFA